MISIKYRECQERPKPVKGIDLRPGDAFMGWFTCNIGNEAPTFYLVTHDRVIKLKAPGVSYRRMADCEFDYIIDRFVDLDITVKERGDC